MRWKVVIAALVVVAAVVAGLGFFWPFGRGTPRMRLAGVVEIQEVRLASKVGGRVAEVFVREGQKVKPGDILVRLEADELEAQKAQAVARLADAEAQWEKAKNGSRREEEAAAWAVYAAAQAKVDRLIAGSRKEEIRQAESEVKAFQADLDLAQEEMNRMQKLHRDGASVRSEYDAARAALIRGQGRLGVARAKLDLLLAGTREEEVREAEAEADKAMANYILALEGPRAEDRDAAKARVEEARGKVRELDAMLRETTIRAASPSTGGGGEPAGEVRVEVVGVRPGDVVVPNQPVVKVLNAGDQWVKVYVPETDLGRVRLNQEVEVTNDSYPGKRFRGTVIQISSESEFTPRNVQSIDERRHQVFGLKVQVEDPEGIFKSGMAAEVFIPLR